MKSQRFSFFRPLVLSAAVLALTACGKSKSHGGRADVEPTVALPEAATGEASNLMAEPSEHIATNQADPDCPDCVKPDASVVAYPTRPSKIDEGLLRDLRVTVDATNSVLEDGVAILEKHQKEPAAALAALEAYKKEHAARMTELDQKTRDLAVKLKAVGYESDMPPEIKPEYEGRMSKIMERLNAVRGAYAHERPVLTSFGAFIPTGQ